MLVLTAEVNFENFFWIGSAFLEYFSYFFICFVVLLLSITPLKPRPAKCLFFYLNK